MAFDDLKAQAEDAYYSLAEKIPFFPFVLAALVIVLLAGIYIAITPASGHDAQITILVKNPAGVPVKGAEVGALWGLESEWTAQTTGDDGTAAFTVPAGEVLDVKVSKPGYEDAKNKFDTAAGTSFEISLKLAQSAGLRQVTINFVGPDGQKLTQREISAKLSCSGSGKFPQDEYIAVGGELKVTAPENCGRINVSATTTGFLTANENVLSSEWIVKFAGAPRPKGKIQFDVRDAANSNFLDGITITIKDSQNAVAGTATTSFGEADFTLPADSYAASVSDPSGNYGTQSIRISVDSGDVPKKQQVLLTKEPKLKAKVKVSEKEGGAAIAGANVALLRPTGETYDEKKSGADGTAFFLIGDDGTLTIQVSKDGYIASKAATFKTTDFPKGSEKLFEVSLGRCGPSTCGLLSIRVLDENGTPVENASVSLLDKDNFLAPYGPVTTDFNGFAPQISGIAAGMYTALAQKYPAQGKSGQFEVKATVPNSVIVPMVIGNGKVNVSAADQSGNPIAFATADIYTDFGNKIGTIALDAEGKGPLERVKADRRVYAVVRKGGYAPYFSSHQQVVKDRTLQFSAVLEQAISGTAPVAEFRGLFAAGSSGTATGGTGAAVQSMQAGKAYTAKFVLRVPTGTNFDAAGFFLRAGEKPSAENDALFVESLSAALPAITRGSTYRPPTGETTPATGSAKWASLQWNRPEGGKYEIEITVRVREGTTKGTELPLHYRSWGVAGGKYSRDPADNVLTDKADVPARANLYAESQLLLYLESLDQLCKDSFCFTTRLLDTSQNLYVQAPYKVNTFSPYTLEFALTGNSPSILDSSTLSIRNTRDGSAPAKDISIDAYDITNADTQRKTSATPAFEVSGIASGNLRQNKSIRGELTLSAKSATPSALEFKLLSNQNIAFASLVPFTGLFQDDINITISPDTVAAFIPADLAVMVQYAQGEKKGFGVDGARVIVTRKAPDLSETIFTAATDAQGIARLQIPASSPGTKLTVRAEKAGLASRTAEKEIGGQVASFSPANVNVELNRQTRESANSKVVVKSLISRPLVVKKITLSTNSRGLLDEEKMQSALAQYAGAQLPKQGSEKEISVLSSLGKEAQFLDTPKAVSGKLIAELALKDDPRISWVTELPYTAQLNLAQMPSNAPCISISSKEWKDTTLNSRSDLEFEIENHCVSGNGEPITLRNLQARIDWGGEDGQTGQVELSVTDPNSGTSSAEILRQGEWSRLSERLEPRLIYAGRLTFSPKPNTLGKKGEFTVKIDAELVTNAGKQLVGSSNPIEAEITITNLDQCIEISPHPEEGIEIGKTGDESEFTVDISKCGPIAIDLRFCGGGSDQCRGGTKEGGLTLRPWQFSNINESSGGTTRTVKVESQDMPGLYGITVEARPRGGQWRQVAEINTIVKPDTDRYFDLDKYQFTLIGKGSTDDATLTNKMLQETVQVRANMCDWKEAQSGPHFTGGGVAIGMVGGIVVGYLAAQAVAIGALAASGIGAVVAVVIIIIMAVLDDPCAKYATHPLQDYAINLAGTSDPLADRYLPPDVLDIMMGDSHIGAKWNAKITDAILKSAKNGKQTVGVVFENRGITRQKPLYAIGTFRATEHVHGDTAHQNGSVNCTGGNFGFFWINPGTCAPSYDTTYSQKFHLKFNTAEQRASLPKVSFDTQACQSGLDIGRTGKGALPRVKFNWSWKENAGGIGAEACDASNQNYIYCDATQFTIELNKKIGRLYDFLSANNFDLGCPVVPDPGKETQDEIAKSNGTHEIAQGAMGIYKVEPAEDKGSISALVTVKNNTDADQNLTLALDIRNGGAYSEGCVLELPQIPAHGQKQSLCAKQYTAKGAYAIYASVKETSNRLATDFAGISTGIYIPDPQASAAAAKAMCELKTTETYSGTPQIMRFIDSRPDVKWTAAVPDKQALLKLFQFDAYLIKDNYSKEFFADFADYYTNGNFEDTDAYFTSLGSDPAGRFGFNRLLQNNKFKFTRRYVETSELPGPGLYRVELAAYFDKGSWNFFASDGKPTSAVAVVVNRIDDPFPDSPFYSMPFDGLVGLKGDSFRRQNYGVAFSNAQPEMAEISHGAAPFKTYPSSGGLGQKQAQVRVERGLYSLNVSPESRGMLLKVDSPPGNRSSITLQPSNATPVMLKVSQAAITQDKFGRHYSILEGENPTNVGASLSYWDGAGTCLDFTGAPVTEAFYQKPDRTLSQTQEELKNYYGQDWPMAIKTGDVYLRTIMYTDPQRNYLLKNRAGQAGATLLTADNSGEAVPLKGIGGMPYNNSGSGTLAAVSSMQDVFDLASEGQICVTNNGNSSKFFWNPQKIYGRQGTERNISTLTNSLEAGSTCIG